MHPDALDYLIAPSLGENIDINVPPLIVPKSKHKLSDSSFMPCAKECTSNLEKGLLGRVLLQSKINFFLDLRIS